MTLDLVRQLHAAGYQIYVAESLPYHLCKSSNRVEKSFLVSSPRQQPQQYIAELLEIIEDEAIDHLIPTCEEIYTIASALERFPSDCQVWCEPLDRLDLFHNKWRFIQMVKQYGWETPQTWLIRSKEEFSEKRKQVDPNRPWILKPVYSRFSSQVMRLDHPHASIGQSFEVSASSPWLLQEWIDGRQICTYSFVVNGKTLAYAAYPTLFTAGGGASISFQPYENQQLQQKVEQLVAAHSLTGQFAFDFIETKPNEWIPIECNPRATSGIHLLSSTANWRRILENEQREASICFTPDPQASFMIGLAMSTYGLVSVRSWQEFRRWMKVFISSKDLLFRLDDLRPFIDQFRMLWHLYSISKRLNISITACSTYDIEWNGEFK